jgi:hypothetical protein
MIGWKEKMSKVREQRIKKFGNLMYDLTIGFTTPNRRIKRPYLSIVMSAVIRHRTKDRIFVVSGRICALTSHKIIAMIETSIG